MPTEPGDRQRAGFTLVELLVVLIVGALLLAGLAGAVSNALSAERMARARNDRLREVRFAMDRMVTAVAGSPRLLLPLAEAPATPWSESVRDVLALVLDPRLDRDGDGFADADNDRDGRIDEDPGADLNADGAAGIAGIDDDGDGLVDESNKEDDDEDEDQRGTKDEEALDGADDDGDASIDEDLGADLNADGAAGIAGIDDDGDGLVDESSKEDDDEDEDQRGTKDEDGFEVVLFRRQGDLLLERIPVPHAANGLQFTEQPIAAGLTRFEARRLPSNVSDRAVLVELVLELPDADGRLLRLVRRVRVGGAL